MGRGQYGPRTVTGDPRFELVLEEARRGLDEQQTSLEQARARAATILGRRRS